MRRIAALVLSVVLLTSVLGGGASAGEPPLKFDLVRLHYKVRADFRYEYEIEQHASILADTLPEEFRERRESYAPGAETLTLLETTLFDPDGSAHALPAGSVRDEPSPRAPGAPGLVSSRDLVVSFPPQRRGGRRVDRLRFVEKKPLLPLFTEILRPFAEVPIDRLEIILEVPAAMPLRWQADPGYTVNDQTRGATRTITATLLDYPGNPPEPASVGGLDVLPLFVVTTLKSWEEFASLYHASAKDKAKVTPRIAQLAAKITGGLSGVEATRAIHNWIINNIDYKADYITRMDGWRPRAAEKILDARAGDCKDYVTLMQALLAARGIASEPVLVSLGDSYRPPLLPSPLFFNHAIIYLPEADLYADPTDRGGAMEVLGYPLVSKTVLHVGAKPHLARLPDADPSHDRYRLSDTTSFDAEGTLFGQSRMTLYGALDAAKRPELAATPMGVLASTLMTDTDTAGFANLHLVHADELDRHLEVEGKWISPRAFTPADRVLLRVPSGPDLQNQRLMRSFLFAERHRPVVIGARTVEWFNDLEIPASHTLEGVPPPVSVRNPVGAYRARYSLENGVLHSERALVIARTVVPVNLYPALAELIFAAIEDSRATLVLLRK